MRLPHFIKDYTFFRYGVIGVLGTIIDVGLLYIFVEYGHLHLLAAATLSFFCAVCNNFFFNKFWTFKNKEKNAVRQYIKFFTTACVGLLLNNLFLSLFVYTLHIWYIFSKLITSGIVFFWNFFINKFWTFASYHIEKNTIEESPRYDLSIIIPALNEEKNIVRMLSDVLTFFQTRPETFHIIVVDDGSTDSTAYQVELARKKNPHISCIRLDKNYGKGYAIKMGVMRSQGTYILFADADGSTPFEECEKLFTALQENDIAIGSRYLSQSTIRIKQPWYRILLGRVGNKLIQLFLLKGINDTQCGFKAFTFKAAKDIFPRQTIHHWGFDMEILTLAKHMGYSIKEIPVSWHNRNESRFRPIQDAHRTLRDLITIKWNLLTKKY